MFSVLNKNLFIKLIILNLIFTLLFDIKSLILLLKKQMQRRVTLQEK